jgi:AraC family transcriptional regulator
MMRTGTAESYQERINCALAHIQERLDDPLPLEDLAERAHFSPYHFHRIFRGMVGESVKEHIRRLRLERAAQRLRDTADPITDIAFDAGYETHESFTRAFRAMFGDSPSGFRENRRELRRSALVQAMPGEPLRVRLERIGRTRLAFVRHVGPFEGVGAAWNRLFAWAGRNGLLGPAAEMLGVIHDDPEITPPERLRYDAALVVTERVRPEGDVGIEELPPAEYAVTLHRGPYETLYLTYARLCGEWLPSSGREALAAPGLEFYRNTPQTTRPDDLITEIYIPLTEE